MNAILCTADRRADGGFHFRSRCGPKSSPADQLGWQLAVHSWTFQKFTIYDAIDKAAAVGVKHMSISGGVNLEVDGKPKRFDTALLSAAEFAAIRTRLIARGLSPKFLNMGVVKPDTNEAASRKNYEAAPVWD